MLSRSLLLLIGLAFSGASSAAIVSYDYTAILLNGGATLTGAFGYDNSTVDNWPEPDAGLYSGAGFWSGVVSGGPQDGISFNFNSIDITIFNNDPDLESDLFLAGFDTTSIELSDEAQAAFSDDSLPSFLTLADFDIAGIALGVEVGSNSEQIYDINTISAPHVVPLPPAIWLFGSALMGLVGWSRKKRTI